MRVRTCLVSALIISLSAVSLALALQPPERPRDGVPAKLPPSSTAPSASAPAGPGPLRSTSDSQRLTEGAHSDRPSSEVVPGLGPIGPALKVCTGLRFAEGPAADPEGSLYFCDLAVSRILKLDLSGQTRRIAEDSNRASGIKVNARGDLVVCESDGSVALYSHEGKRLQTLADRYLGKPLNAPNDLVIDAVGGVYFTDPFFGRTENMRQEKQGVYYMRSAGDLARLVDDLPQPNGIALSPDEKTLYVVATGQPRVMAYPITAPGRIDSGRVFCMLQRSPGLGTGGGDGCTVDAQGNLYIATMIGVQVFSPAGKLLGVIRLLEIPSNLAFGGKDYKTLFVTARTSIYALPMLVKGHHFPAGKS